VKPSQALFYLFHGGVCSVSQYQFVLYLYNWTLIKWRPEGYTTNVARCTQAFLKLPNFMNCAFMSHRARRTPNSSLRQCWNINPWASQCPIYIFAKINLPANSAGYGVKWATRRFLYFYTYCVCLFVVLINAQVQWFPTPNDTKIVLSHTKVLLHVKFQMCYYYYYF
jgi:hypothetical protein